MTRLTTTDALDLSRRAVFRHAAAVAAGGGVLMGLSIAVGQAAAATKMAQKAVAYQETPKGRARCDGCSQWQAPAACKVVAGTINPAGWCTLYAAKG